MGLLRSPLAIVSLAAKRLWSSLGLMMGTAVGLIVAVALATSIPLYAASANNHLLQEALTDGEGRSWPPFAFMFRYVGSWHGPLAWQELAAANTYFAGPCQRTIGLPQQMDTRLVQTDNLRLYPAGAAANANDDAQASLGFVALGFATGIEGHVRLVDGEMPVAPADTGDPLPVAVAVELANKLGLNAGDDLVAWDPDNLVSIPLRVTGVWQANDPVDPYWFYQPSAFDQVMLAPEASWVAQVASKLAKPVNLAVWYQIYDGSSVRAEGASALAGRIVRAQAAAASALANTELGISPLDALERVNQMTRTLAILLYVFAIPTAGLILYFIVQMAGLVVQRQRNEIAVLRSRGLSALQVAGLYLAEGLILGAVAIALGPVLGMGVATMMRRTQAFLVFGPSQTAVVVEFSQRALLMGLAVVAGSVLAGVLPALRAARHTIVTYKQDVARTLERPWWQRAYLDVILLVAPLYGYYQLRARGSIGVLGSGSAGAQSDPFGNPLLFLTPALFVFALALVFVRLFPMLAAFLCRGAQRLRSVALVLASRQLARSSRQYTGPLLLTALTVGLACFAASAARTLDQGLIDQAYYAVGADLRLTEASENPARAQLKTTPGATSAEEPARDEWYILPVSEHLRADGVEGAARMGKYLAALDLGGAQTSGVLLGVDRYEFGQIGYFRDDFSTTLFGELMNDLAQNDKAVLVSSATMTQLGLAIGDPLNLLVAAEGKTATVPFVVAGSIDAFPTVYSEEDGNVFFVCNLDYMFECLQGEFPYDVLLRTAPTASTAAIVAQLNDLGLEVTATQDARATIAKERARPERQGVLGLLSAGFLASALLTVLGYLLYAFLSFRRRLIELGVLRAIGLSLAQMAAYLALEQAILIVAGVLAGTGLGVVASELFIPFLQVGSTSQATMPPFFVQIAWGDILRVGAILGAMLLVAIAGLVVLMVRMRIAQAVKLGEVA